MTLCNISGRESPESPPWPLGHRKGSDILTPQHAPPALPDASQHWQPLLDGIKARRQEMKPHSDKLDHAIRSVLLEVQAALEFPGSIDPPSVGQLCDSLDGLPDSYVDYTNHQRNYDYWNSCAVWSLSHESPDGLYSSAGAANSSFAVTTYLSISMVMRDMEQPHINVHVYPAARLSVANRPRLAEIIHRQTGLPVLKCTHGDGCV
jgi:hypothetical protein